MPISHAIPEPVDKSRDPVRERPVIRQQTVRSPARVTIYVLVSFLAIASLGIVFLDAIRSPVRVESEGTSGQRTPRDTFEDLYQIAWRADGTAGNTAVEAVYYFPGLIESLQAYDQRSFIQAQTLQAIELTDPSLFPFVIQLEHATDLDQALTVQDHAVLIADGVVTYRPVPWQPFTPSQEARNIIVGALFFERPAGSSDPHQFSLTLKDLPGNQRPSTFSWNLDVLKITGQE